METNKIILFVYIKQVARSAASTSITFVLCHATLHCPATSTNAIKCAIRAVAFHAIAVHSKNCIANAGPMSSIRPCHAAQRNRNAINRVHVRIPALILCRIIATQHPPVHLVWPSPQSIVTGVTSNAKLSHAARRTSVVACHAINH